MEEEIPTAACSRTLESAAGAELLRHGPTSKLDQYFFLLNVIKYISVILVLYWEKSA